MSRSGALTIDDAARQACDHVGIIWKPVQPDGRWHYVDVADDRRGKDDGRLKYFSDGEGGLAYNWKTGVLEPFFAGSSHELTGEEIARRAELRARAHAELAAQREKAIRTARSMWTSAKPLEEDGHPYLILKGIEPHGARVRMSIRSKGASPEPAIILPIYGPDGKISSVQHIYADKAKRCLANATKAGGLYIVNHADGGPMLTAEGFATCASIAEATGCMVVCAFDSSNFAAIAKRLAAGFPGRELIICGDRGNGEQQAISAAADVAGRCVIPDFSGLDATESDTDFNDLARLAGLGTVRKQIMAARGARHPGGQVTGAEGLKRGVTTKREEVTRQQSKPMTQKHLNGKAPAEDVINILDAPRESDLPIINPPQLVKRILPKGGLVIMGGQSGAGKTFCAVYLAVSLAAYSAYFGYAIRERVGVIYIAAEGKATIGARINAAKRAIGIDEPLPIRVIRRPPFLGADPKAYIAFATQLTALAKSMKEEFGIRVGAIILDTVSAAITMKDENDNAAIAEVCRNLRMLGDPLDAVMIAVHHFGKDAERGLRGASAWKANVDHALSILADRDEATGKVDKRSFNIIKNQVGDEGPVSAFELLPVQVGINSYDEAEWSCSVKPTDLPPQEEKTRSARHDYQRIAKVAVEEVINGSSIIRQVFGSGPLMRCASMESIKEEFYRRWLTGGASGKSGAWKRAVDFIQNSREFGKEATGHGAEFVWLLKSEVVRNTTEDRETSSF